MPTEISTIILVLVSIGIPTTVWLATNWKLGLATLGVALLAVLLAV